MKNIMILLITLLLCSCTSPRATRDNNLEQLFSDYKSYIRTDPALTNREKQTRLNEVRIYETTYN